MPLEKNDDLSTLLERARLTVDELSRSGAWTRVDDERLDALFEQAAVAALKVPAFAERSLMLRRLGVRFVPKSLRPPLKKCARLADRMLRALYGVVRRS